MIKKIGIVCNTYKLIRFKRLLESNDFKYEIKGFFTPTTKTIIIYADESRIKEVKKICQKVEIDSKQSN